MDLCSCSSFRAWLGPADDRGPHWGLGYCAKVWIFPVLVISRSQVSGPEGTREGVSRRRMGSVFRGLFVSVIRQVARRTPVLGVGLGSNQELGFPHSMTCLYLSPSPGRNVLPWEVPLCPIPQRHRGRLGDAPLVTNFRLASFRGLQSEGQEVPASLPGMQKGAGSC